MRFLIDERVSGDPEKIEKAGDKLTVDTVTTRQKVVNNHLLTVLETLIATTAISVVYFLESLKEVLDVVTNTPRHLTLLRGTSH